MPNFALRTLLRLSITYTVCLAFGVAGNPKWLTRGMLVSSRLLRRMPLTIILFLGVSITFLITGTVARGAWPWLMERFGWDLNALQEGRLYAPWVGLLFASRPGEHPTMLGMLLLGVGSLEFRRGTKAAAAAFLVLGPWPASLLCCCYGL